MDSKDLRLFDKTLMSIKFSAYASFEDGQILPI